MIDIYEIEYGTEGKCTKENIYLLSVKSYFSGPMKTILYGCEFWSHAQKRSITYLGKTDLNKEHNKIT
jgi:hypothetical protein